MKLTIYIIGLIIGIAGIYTFIQYSTTPNPNTMVKTLEESLKDIPADAAKATFAGGCFWCMESAFEGQDGVYEAISGYAGGDEETADYRTVSSGRTEHREGVQVYYNPTEITYQQLLEVFWRQIDPTDDGGQFADRGPQYRTAIFYHDEKQKALAEESKKNLEESGKFTDPIATKIIEYTTFFPAEEEHQNFAQKKAEYYQQYKKGSGRADYIEETWEK